jgi:hypothetical protein
MGLSVTHLQRYLLEGLAFLSHIITGDETWVHHTPELKAASMEWKTATSPTETKFKRQKSGGKALLPAFWDEEGLLHMEFLEGGRGVM